MYVPLCEIHSDSLLGMLESASKQERCESYFLYISWLVVRKPMLRNTAGAGRIVRSLNRALQIVTLRLLF